MSRFRLFVCSVAVALIGTSVHAACMNKYVYRRDGMKVMVTVLTGKLTFQEARDLAKAIADKRAEPVEWLDGSGKVLARSSVFDVKRPMPVGCDGKTSGSVIEVTFLRNIPPSGNLQLKLGAEVVTFEEQKK